MDEPIDQKKIIPQRYEPGELDKTRKNIGNLDPAEAQKIAKLLGGEVGVEKSAPIDEAALKKVRSAIKTRELRSGNLSEKPQRSAAIRSSSEKSAAGQSAEVSALDKKNSRDVLPEIPSKERAKIERLMISTEYQIKQNYGIFNIFASLTKNGQEKISASFVTVTLKNYILRMQGFSNKIKELTRSAPELYIKKLETDDDLKFKMLKTVGSWSLQNIQSLYADMERKPTEITVTMMVPFIKQIYKPLLSVFFLGESRLAELIKSVYMDISVYPDAKKERVFAIAKETVAEWLYVYNRVIKGLYPLLMRMCSSDFQVFPDFFMIHTSKIFTFLNITKFDVLIPEKKLSQTNTTVPVREKTPEQLEQETRQKENDRKHAELVSTGLKLLDKIFPGADWTKLDTIPDMYPFYQPLFNFTEGLNFISPENPMQIVIILIKIIEDFMEGCRNITFAVNSEKRDAPAVLQSDSFTKIMNEWSVYRETLFEKLYVTYLKDLVNHLYTQKDFTRTQYGKKLVSSILWHTRYNFLPYIQFEQLLLEKPINEAKVRPLYSRTPVLVKELFRLTLIADDAAKSGKESLEIPNINDQYRFDIPNVVSRRIDVLLGAKKKQAGHATNANLLKYMLSVSAVLDWWINNKNSPAYANADNRLYRISEEDGSPIFSVPERTDQNELFIRSIKTAAAVSKPSPEPDSDTPADLP